MTEEEDLAGAFFKKLKDEEEPNDLISYVRARVNQLALEIDTSVFELRKWHVEYKYRIGSMNERTYDRLMDHLAVEEALFYMDFDLGLSIYQDELLEAYEKVRED
jgi:hypothetical protein